MVDLVKKEGYGFSFDESACASCNGACCIGESGYIWLTPKEIKKMSEYLTLDERHFREEYLIKVGYRFSIKERKVGESYECLFFDTNAGGCSVYPVRPTQCRTFPFWNHFRKHPSEVKAECPGIII
jgi:uncharacterized protein